MINKRFFKTKDEVEVTFELEAQEANSVSIVADFLDWEATPMKKLAKGKVFKFKVRQAFIISKWNDSFDRF